MPKVRIVDPHSGFKMSLPVPYKLFVNTFLRRAVVLKLLSTRIKALTDEYLLCAENETKKRHRLEKAILLFKSLIPIVDKFDYGELRSALTHIDGYRGLVLVDVTAADGTIVHITL